MSHLFMGLSTDLQQPIRWQLLRQRLKVQASLRRMGQWDYRAHTHTHTHAHSRDTGESRSGYLPVCVHARSPVCVGGPKHTRVGSWVKVCYLQHSAVCVCLCAGRWVVAFQRARLFN